MSSNSFLLKVFTPGGLVLETTASEVTVPTSMGEIGVLPLHASYTGLLGTGVVSYLCEETKAPKRFVVSEGFVSFSDNTLTLLADHTDFAEDIDQQSYSSQRADFEKLIKSGNTLDPDHKFAVIGLKRIEAIERIISH